MYRHFFLEIFEDISVDEYYNGNMFNFNHELILQQVTVGPWDLKYILFVPIASMAQRKLILEYVGAEFDYIPILHPMRCPQSMC